MMSNPHFEQKQLALLDRIISNTNHLTEIMELVANEFTTLSKLIAFGNHTLRILNSASKTPMRSKMANKI
ncbi:hypothetical protein O9G_001428 [Rozella allomycis CSF55]|uniref:Uncharacterized protein n=1 Tax=Rozella allomycis (strain CSF55) TaxID=988480 RepID=A0A075B311_ROZAC|nr:hypothetical protein O9G_001428 [Rozella allomycis CSF55]|eukprot:EPZ36983.1 hypothetical protein O9G_001428 [Rozella allomycis CSF55]